MATPELDMEWSSAGGQQRLSVHKVSFFADVAQITVAYIAGAWEWVMESQSCFQYLFANSGDWNTKSTSRESTGVQKGLFVILEDIWLKFRNANKAIKVVLYFIKLCKWKENFFLLLEQSVTKY